MQVKLVRITEDPMGAIESAACNCYNSTPTKSHAIANSCYKSGHTSVFEFSHFHFHITGVSRSLLAQLTRHRMSSFSVESQRYVDMTGFDYIIPNDIKNNPEALKLYTDCMDVQRDTYAALYALGIEKEDARQVLPNACETVLDFAMNGRSLMHFMNLRLCTRTQWELRQLAQKMRDAVLEVSSEWKDKLVPQCEIYPDFPFCTEEKCCGRHPTIAEVYHPPVKEEKEVDTSSKKLKYTYLIVGRSGAGKDTIVNELCKRYGCTRLNSYTTRPRRKDEGDTHEFITEAEFDLIPEDQKFAYTEINGYRYCSTLDQARASDFYVIDPFGVETIKHTGLPVKCIGIDVGSEEATHRMLDRGDKKESIFNRVTHDFDMFAGFEKKMDKVVQNDNLEECLEEIWAWIQKTENE